jgi:CheY-like chemotaxis protein
VIRALIAEDHPAYQTIMQTALEFAGYEVELAVNGREAIDALCKGLFHVLFMDLNMPVMHGLDALRIIRAQNLWADIQIVVVTANPHMAGEEVEQLSDYLMMKPINVEELALFAERLKTVSRRAAPGKSTPSQATPNTSTPDQAAPSPAAASQPISSHSPTPPATASANRGTSITNFNTQSAIYISRPRSSKQE